MPTFKVTWEAKVTADTFQQATNKARKRVHSLSAVVDVTNTDTNESNEMWLNVEVNDDFIDEYVNDDK